MTNEVPARTHKIQTAIDYPTKLLPQNLGDLIERMDSRDNRAVGRAAKHEMNVGEFSDGVINAVKKAIQAINRADQTAGSAKAAREERILRIRDSSGKNTARRR